MNKVITIEKGDTRYEDMVSLVGQASTDNLIIVAKNHDNRKATIKPITVRNGIYFYVASVVNNALIYPTNYTDKEVEIAKANTVKNAVIGDMAAALLGGMTSLSDWDPTFMNILTTNGGVNGAGILLCSDYLTKIFDKIGDYYILPSSVHEVIIVPKANYTADISDLSNMVKTINADIVDDTDVLSDEAFEYSDWI